jgi:hypothetical protein
MRIKTPGGLKLLKYVSYERHQQIERNGSAGRIS